MTNIDIGPKSNLKSFEQTKPMRVFIIYFIQIFRGGYFLHYLYRFLKALFYKSKFTEIFKGEIYSNRFLIFYVRLSTAVTDRLEYFY